MKRIFKLSVFMLIIISLIFGYLHFKPNKIDTQLNQLQSQIDKYKQEEQAEKLKKLELQQLQNPKIIKTEFQNVGKLIVKEGTYTYKDIIKINKWYGHKELYTNLIYKFGMAIDLNTITIDKFIDKTVYVSIPINDIKLEYLELDNDSSKITGDKSWFISDFKPDDINIILQNSNEKVESIINKDKSIYTESLSSLKENIKSLILKLNYDDVVFSETI